MGWLHFLLLLYLSSKVSALNECNSCECCKTKRCEFQNGNHGACLDGCIAGYYGANCRHACISNCLACQDASSCTTCRSGFYGAYCDRCPDNCSACSSKSNCKTCRDGFYSGTKQDFESNPIYTDCRYECQGNCKSCTSFNNCTSCKNGFYNGCQYKISNHYYSDCPHPCKDTCKSCTSYDTCTVCKDGEYNGDHTNCSESCPSACKACTSYTNCTKCETGKYGPSCQNDCGIGCQNRQCDKSTGACSCVSGFQGEFCINCSEGYHNTFMNCTCRKDFCKDIKCTSCLNSTYYAFNASCCPCASTCKNRKCLSANKCTNGCIDGYHRDDCSGMCKYVDQYCLKCTDDFANSSGECQECISGYNPHNTTKKCENCSENCFDEICNAVHGKCKKGCKDGYWGEKCEDSCDGNCLRCDQLNGECSICRSGKYLKDCSKDCNTNCSITNSFIMCAVDDGACLSGCNTQSKYGSHCEMNCSSNCLNNTCNWKTGYCLNGCVDTLFGEHCNNTCSDNCVRNVRGGRSCNTVNGHCIHGCKDGFRGDTCKEECSENCVNNLCDKETGKCVQGCRKGFESSSCTEGQTREGTDEDDTIVTVWVSAGACFFVLTIIAVTVMKILLKKRRSTENGVRVDMNVTNDNAAVIYSEMLTGAPVVHHDDTCTLSPMLNKQTRNVPESMSLQDITETNTVNNRNYDNVKPGNAAVYENVEISHSQPPAAKEHTIHSEEFEEEPKNIAVRESKSLANGSLTNQLDAADTYYNVTAVKKRRIMLDELAYFVSKKTKGNFAEEFLQLPAGLIKPYNESQRRENILKNRYRGLYPYDDTRVILSDGCSDYINASYIDGYVKRRAYIASVGPTYKYMGDMSAFWRMVWQEQVGKIVMLTKLSEAGIPKCDQYWPNKDFTNPYADVKVACNSEEIYANYTVRSFVAQKAAEKRPIVQVHFTAWPDKGIPDDVTSLIEFREKVNSIKTTLDGPIVVHCSAGIGRTGTYIALDSLTIEGEVEGSVDIYACVRNLREQRVYMVQTAEQYRYLHHAVVHTLTFDSKAVEATTFSDYMSTLSDDRLGENFQKLQASVESRPDDEIVAVMKNKSLNKKNRKGADIPGDRNRPRLFLDRHVGSSDYINALYVNSFKSVNHFIVSQTPMPNTVDDFLTLIVQEKVICVIDMEPQVTKQDNVGTYFPADNQTLQKGTFTVKSEPGEKTDQYTSKQLKISYKNSKEITVKHIQFTKWDDKTNLPADPGEFVRFIKDIELTYSDSEKEGPILVHCLTGAEKSGLFCVISILLEKTQINQEISVVNTVRQIKYRRHMSVPNKEQYKFCHQCLHEYLRSFGTYSNICLKI